MIVTQKYACGRYLFRSWLPRLGTSADVPQWNATVDGEEVPGMYGSLDDAMRAALDWGASK